MNFVKQVAWDEDLESLDLCAGARSHSAAHDAPDNHWLKAICESVEEWADRDEDSELFEGYMVVLNEPQQDL